MPYQFSFEPLKPRTKLNNNNNKELLFNFLKEEIKEIIYNMNEDKVNKLIKYYNIKSENDEDENVYYNNIQQQFFGIK